jgi:hypothetical protein
MMKKIGYIVSGLIIAYFANATYHHRSEVNLRKERSGIQRELEKTIYLASEMERRFYYDDFEDFSEPAEWMIAWMEGDKKIESLEKRMDEIRTEIPEHKRKKWEVF